MDLFEVPALSNEFPWIYPYVFSHLLPATFELGYFEFPAISNSSFFPYKKITNLSTTEYKKKLPSDRPRVRSVKQSRLSHAAVCLLLREPRFNGKQASCHSRSTKVSEKNQKQQNIQRFFQYSSVCWFIRHIITVFLFHQCLSSYSTVFYCGFYASTVIPKAHYFELFSISLVF